MPSQITNHAATYI